MKKILSGVCIVLFFTIPFLTDSKSATVFQTGQDAEKIVARIVEAHGGAHALRNVESHHARGKVRAEFLKDEGSYERWLVRDRKLRVETIYKRSAEYRVLNGRKGFRGTENIPIAEVTDHMYMAMVYQYKQLEMAYGLSRQFYKVTYTGGAEVGGVRCIVLDVADEEGPSMKVYADKTTFLIVKTTGLFSIGERVAELSAEFADYRKIDGIMLPFRITNYGSGQLIGETVIEKYELNSNIKDALFSPFRKAKFP